MTIEKAKKIIKSECYIADLLNLDRTRMVNTALDTVIKAAEETRWIPVKEELPEIDRYVLVHLTDSYYDPIQIMSLHLRESTEADNEWNIYWKTQEESIEFDAEDVIAWMPLPQPYKAEGE